MVERHSNRTRARVPNLPSKSAQANASVAARCIEELSEIKRHLEFINSAVAVATGALERQAADIDLDVASILRSSVRSPLADQLERLSALIRKLQ